MPHEIIDATEGPLVVTALDFDGCIERNSDSIKVKVQYLESQADLLTFLDENKTNVILSGSNRTTPGLDEGNARHHRGVSPGASFNVFPWLADKEKHRVFNPFLLNDLWATHQDGTLYENGDTIASVKALFKLAFWNSGIITYKDDEKKARPNTKDNADKDNHSDKIFMNDKINIVYAHLHYLAHAYPNKQISYQLVDDKTNYLYAISYFYNTHPELIPDNVSIQLIKHHYGRPDFHYIHTQSTLFNVSDLYYRRHPKRELSKHEYKHYDAKKISAEKKHQVTIKGTGIKDPSYKESVKRLSAPEHNPDVVYTLDDDDNFDDNYYQNNYYAGSIDVRSFLKERDTLIAKHKAKEDQKAMKAVKTADKAVFFKPAKLTNKPGEAPNHEELVASAKVPSAK